MEFHLNANLPIAVFVHLGPKLPRHLISNLTRHTELFPEIETVLIVDHPVKDAIPTKVETFYFSESKEDSNLFTQMQDYSHFNFRNGFWKYTFLRLFALAQFHKTIPSRRLLHIESDVILMPNFPWEKFLKLKNVSWMRVNSFNDVAALVYLPNSHETEFFIESIRKYAYEDPKTTDMFAMFKFSSENSNRHSYLPSNTPDRVRRGVFFDSNQEEMIKLFGGYFDPLALGLWYFGQDPKNAYGFTNRYIDQTHHDYFAPSAKLSFNGEKLMDVSGIQIFCLHVHSKCLSLFDSNWREALSKVLDDAKFGLNGRSFDFRTFLLSMNDRSLRAHLWILLARLPGTSLLRRYPVIENIKNSFKKFFRIQF